MMMVSDICDNVSRANGIDGMTPVKTSTVIHRSHHSPRPITTTWPTAWDTLKSSAWCCTCRCATLYLRMGLSQIWRSRWLRTGWVAPSILYILFRLSSGLLLWSTDDNAYIVGPMGSGISCCDGCGNAGWIHAFPGNTLLSHLAHICIDGPLLLA